MSTGAGCMFTEVEPGRWTYWLQRWPYGETDEGDTFGPFESHEAAVTHLSEHHANPGGWTVKVHERHVHEFSVTRHSAPVQRGVTVSFHVESLGPNPTADEVLGLLTSGRLTADHLSIRPRTVWADAVTCGACGAEKS